MSEDTGYFLVKKKNFEKTLPSRSEWPCTQMDLRWEREQEHECTQWN